MAQTTITLADYIQSPRVPTLTKGVVNIMRDESPLINKLSFNTSKYLRRRNYRGQTSMNEVTWKDLGENFDTVLQGIGDLVEESIYWFGGEIPVAKVLLEASDEVIEDPLTSTIELTTRSMTRQFCDTFINGTSTANSKSFVGIKERMAKLPASQSICAGGSANLDLSLSSASYAENIERMLLVFNDAFKKCATGKPDFAICDEDWITKFESILRTSGLLSYTKDNFEREFVSYKGVQFIPSGYKSDDTTKIMPGTEDYLGAGTSGDATSIYFVKQGPQYLQPLQWNSLEVKRTGSDVHDINDYTVIRWGVGLMITHPRSVVRVTGLKLS